MAEISNDDIRASVAAGVIDEAQAARILTVSQSRQGFRTSMNDEDEPFELFRGFSEIFVTVGLALLTAGIVALSVALSNPIAIPLVAVLVSVFFARYFTLKRRMTLPSIFLASTFGFSVFFLIALLLGFEKIYSSGSSLVLFLATAAALGVYFKHFRVPFVMFLIGLCGIGIAYSAAGLILPEVFHRESARNTFLEFLNVGQHPLLGLTMLVFGLVAFVAAMSFDLRDPHRVSRHAASAFWLHILAAPAIVNVVSVSLLAIGGAAGYLLAALALVLITAVALIIDRRSFLTAGIIYIGSILVWAISATDLDEGWGIIWTLLIMGSFITALGAWWVSLRTRTMQLLPDFPYKHRLPPYPETE